MAEESCAEDGALSDLKQQLQLQLERSGMTTIIRKLVEDVCMSKDDPLSANPDDVLRAIYEKGLMKNVIQRLDSLNIEKHHPQSDSTPLDTNSLRQNSSYVSILPPEHERCLETEQNGVGRRCYLEVDILGGIAFLDHLSHEAKLVLHAFYKSQRFATKSVDCRCDPHFKDVMIIDIGYFQSGSAAQLLSINEPLRFAIVREDVNLNTAGGGPVISYTLHDWRSVLLTDNGVESFTLKMMGTGSEHNITVGLLNLRLKLLPSPDERVSENSFLAQLRPEKVHEDEQNRSFFTYTKHWMKDFLDIRPDHYLRYVKLFAYDARMISRSVTTFVEPLRSDHLLATPFHAAWFTSLLRVTQMRGISKCHINPDMVVGPNVEHWQSLDITLASKQGGVEDHAVLLCSLFLGFGLNAFVALGSKKGKGLWAWTVTFDNSLNPIFWESTTACEETHHDIIQAYIVSGITGRRLKHHGQPDTVELPDERIKRIKENDVHKFQTIGCLFTNEAFYANIQPTDSVNLISWDILDPSKWKKVPEKVLSVLPHRLHSPAIRAPLVDCLPLNKNIEVEIKNFIAESRLRENLTTRWDDTMSKFMGQQLASYELEASTGGSSFQNFFEVVVMKYIPPGYDFKGFPFQTPCTNARKIFDFCMRDERCHEVVFCRGDNVHLSLRVMAFPYPENTISLRLMIACKFLSTG